MVESFLTQFRESNSNKAMSMAVRFTQPWLKLIQSHNFLPCTLIEIISQIFEGPAESFNKNANKRLTMTTKIEKKNTKCIVY